MSVGTTGAILGAGVLGAGASLGAGAIAAGGARDAGEAALQGTRESIAAQREMTQKGIDFLSQQANQARQDVMPFRNIQLDALGKLQGFADPNNPYFSMQRDAATQAIQRQLAAQGLMRSSKQGAQLQNLELGLIGQRLGVLQGLGGGGSTGGELAQISQNLGAGGAGLYGGLGQQLGSSLAQMGATRAQTIAGQANAWGGALSGVGNAFQGTVGNILANNQQQQQLALLKAILG